MLCRVARYWNTQKMFRPGCYRKIIITSLQSTFVQRFLEIMKFTTQWPKNTFCSTICFQILHFKENCVLRTLKFWVLRVPSIQIPTQSGEMKVLFNTFHRRTNLKALLFSNSGGPSTKILRLLSYKVWRLKVPYGIFCNLWKLFMRPNCASDFFSCKKVENKKVFPRNVLHTQF
jgi:hypothetical protein